MSLPPCLCLDLDNSTATIGFTVIMPGWQCQGSGEFISYISGLGHTVKTEETDTYSFISAAAAAGLAFTHQKKHCLKNFLCPKIKGIQYFHGKFV